MLSQDLKTVVWSYAQYSGQTLINSLTTPGFNNEYIIGGGTYANSGGLNLIIFTFNSSNPNSTFYSHSHVLQFEDSKNLSMPLI